MSQLILLGNPGTKRTIYLEKGALDAGITIQLLDWKDFREKFLKQEDSCRNSVYENFKKEYEKICHTLNQSFMGKLLSGGVKYISLWV